MFSKDKPKDFEITYLIKKNVKAPTSKSRAAILALDLSSSMLSPSKDADGKNITRLSAMKNAV